MSNDLNESSSPSPPPRRGTAAERWLSRLAFSFVIIAAFLVWEAFHLPPELPGAGWRRALHLLSAGAALALGFAGIRARHRMMRD